MSIQEHLNKIRNAIYGREVRESIAKGIETAYDDASENGNANMEVKIARGTHPNLRSRLEEVDNKYRQTRRDTNLQPINVSEMDTETKQLFTGGAVAVVGENAVGKENLKNRSVSIPKLDFTVPSDNMFNGVYTEGLYLAPEGEQLSVSDGSGADERSIIIAVEPQSKYELKVFDDSNRYRMSVFSEYPVVGSISKRRLTFSDSISAPIRRTIQTEDNEHYLFIYLSNLREEPRVNLVRSELGHLVDDFIPYGLIPSDNIRLSKKIEQSIFTNSYDVTGWEYGNLNQGSNSDDNSNIRVRTPIFKMYEGNTVKLQENTSIQDISIHLYNALTGEFIERFLYNQEFTVDDDYLVRITSRFRDDAEIENPYYYNGKVTVHLQDRLSEEMERVIFTNRFDVTGWENGNLSEGNETENGIATRVRSSVFKLYESNTVKLQEGTSIQDITIHLYDSTTGEFVERILYVQEFKADDDYLARISSRFKNNAEIDTNYYNGKVTVYLQETADNKTMNTKYISGNFTEFYRSKDFVYDIDIGNSNHQDVYVAWDNLMNEHPNIITKKLLGYATNTEGGEDLERPIYEYEINTNRTRMRGISESPTFLVMTGTHGTERAVVWSTFHYFEQLLKNWTESDSLASVRSNMTFKVIPVYNSYGYDNKARINARGVDLNRNLSYNWETTPTEGAEGAGTNKGTAPYSEQESKVLKQWLEENRRSFAFIDFHGYGGTQQPETVSNMSYITTTAPRPPIVYTSVLKRISSVWEREYFNKEESKVYGWANVSSLPATQNEAYTVGNVDFSATIEMANGYKTRWSKELVEMGVDLLANYISSSIDYLINS